MAKAKGSRRTQQPAVAFSKASSKKTVTGVTAKNGKASSMSGAMPSNAAMKTAMKRPKTFFAQ